MAPESYTRWNPYNNLPTNLTRKQNKLVGPQSSVKRFDIGSNEVFTTPEALIALFILLTKDVFIKFMKIFVKLT